jgi:hypothetical protein
MTTDRKRVTGEKETIALSLLGVKPASTPLGYWVSHISDLSRYEFQEAPNFDGIVNYHAVLTTDDLLDTLSQFDFKLESFFNRATATRMWKASDDEFLLVSEEGPNKLKLLANVLIKKLQEVKQ